MAHTTFSLRNNIAANFGGQAVSVLIGVAFMPVYIRILGIEAYGLIGFFLSLQAFFTTLDMGLSATLNRELARYSHSGVAPEQKRDLVRTLEWLYWPMGAVIAIAVAFIAEPIASHWLKPVSYTANHAAYAIMLMGLAAALQWPSALYAGGLRGLERQVTLNALNASFATIRALGAVAVLVYFAPTLAAFLWWQIIIGAVQTACSRTLLWRMLPPAERAPEFRPEILRQLQNFTLGMTGIAALSFLLLQSDRIILSTLLPLTEFGYYTVAATVAAALSSSVGPFFNALYPRYSGLVSTGSEEKLITLYHHSNQLLAVVVASTAAVLGFFAADFLRIWTHDPQLANKSALILSVLVLGTALNGLMHLPYALQLAYGWTRFALYQNIVAVVIVVPSIWLLAQHFGGVGAASVWVALNLGYLTISIPLMHRKLLPEVMGEWYLRDILPPVLSAIATAGALRLALPTLANGLGGMVVLACIGMVTLGVSAVSSATVRSGVMKYFQPWIS